MKSLYEIAQEIHQNAIDHGFWEFDPETGLPERNFGESIALMHSELSEALEAHREGHPDVYFVDQDSSSRHLKPEGYGVELIDCIIRCLDVLGSLQLDVDRVLELKMRYNQSRPIKHGKSY